MSIDAVSGRRAASGVSPQRTHMRRHIVGMRVRQHRASQRHGVCEQLGGVIDANQPNDLGRLLHSIWHQYLHFAH